MPLPLRLGASTQSAALHVSVSSVPAPLSIEVTRLSQAGEQRATGPHRLRDCADGGRCRAGGARRPTSSGLASASANSVEARPPGRSPVCAGWSSCRCDRRRRRAPGLPQHCQREVRRRRGRAAPPPPALEVGRVMLQEPPLSAGGRRRRLRCTRSSSSPSPTRRPAARSRYYCSQTRARAASTSPTSWCASAPPPTQGA